MRRNAKPRLRPDEKSRLEQLGWDSEQSHQPMPIDEPGTADVVRDDGQVLSLGDAGRETRITVEAAEELLKVRR